MDRAITFGELFKLIAPETGICLFVDPDAERDDDDIVYSGIASGLSISMVEFYQDYPVKRISSGDDKDVFASKNGATGEMAIFYLNQVNIRLLEEE